MRPINTPALLFAAMRPRQWAKNALVLAALIFARRAGDLSAVAAAFAAAVAFCLLSSSVYLVNDIVDIEEDRQHPKKRDRPLASGRLQVRTALVVAVVLALLGLAGSLWLSRNLFLVAAGYYLLTLAYHFLLKHIVVIDVLTVSAGFVLRAVAGAVVIQEEISHWLYICTILLALFLALAKRRQEIVLLSENARHHRRILAEYTPEMLDQMITIVTATTLMAYCLYTIAPRTTSTVGSEGLLFTVPFVIYGIFRYLYLIHRYGQGGAPEQILLGDLPLLVNVLLYIVVAAIVLYSGGSYGPPHPVP